MQSSSGTTFRPTGKGRSLGAHHHHFLVEGTPKRRDSVRMAGSPSTYSSITAGCSEAKHGATVMCQTASRTAAGMRPFCMLVRKRWRAAYVTALQSQCVVMKLIGCRYQRWKRRAVAMTWAQPAVGLAAEGRSATEQAETPTVAHASRKAPECS